jgi:hypothetical protein
MQGEAKGRGKVRGGKEKANWADDYRSAKGIRPSLYTNKSLLSTSSTSIYYVFTWG